MQSKLSTHTKAQLLILLINETIYCCFPSWSEELKYHTRKNYYEESLGQVGKTHFVAKKLVTNY